MGLLCWGEKKKRNESEGRSLELWSCQWGVLHSTVCLAHPRLFPPDNTLVWTVMMISKYNKVSSAQWGIAFHTFRTNETLKLCSVWQVLGTDQTLWPLSHPSINPLYFGQLFYHELAGRSIAVASSQLRPVERPANRHSFARLLSFLTADISSSIMRSVSNQLLASIHFPALCSTSPAGSWCLLSASLYVHNQLSGQYVFALSGANPLCPSLESPKELGAEPAGLHSLQQRHNG